jgi:hypothetical protein
MIKLLNLLTPDNSNEHYLRAKLTVIITVLINFQVLASYMYMYLQVIGLWMKKVQSKLKWLALMTSDK